MKNNKKLTILIGLILVLVIATTGTIAWLTKTSSITNTFTVGDFKPPTTSPTNPEESITINGNIYEPSWNAEEEHKLLPGVSFEKDPYVGIGAGSEDAAVYVYVENNFSNKIYFTINEGWEAVEATSGLESETYTSGLFKYTNGLQGQDSKDTWTITPLFSTIKADDTAELSDFTVEDSKKTEIKVSAFLHQAKDGEGALIPDETIENAAKTEFKIN